MRRKSISRVLAASLCLLAPLTVLGATTVSGKPAPPPSSGTVTWTGNGTTTDGTTRSLKLTVCDGPSTPYLAWVLSGSKASSATLNIPGESLGFSMGKPSVDKKTGYSTFKYTWTAPSSIDLGTLLAGPVTASYNDAKNKAVLTVAQGCLGPSGPVCASAPAPLDQKVLANRPTFTAVWPSLTATTGAWQDLAGCTNTFSYAFVDAGGYSSGVSSSNTLNVQTAVGLPCDVFVEVTATNSIGATTAASAFGDTDTCSTPAGWGDGRSGQILGGASATYLSPVGIGSSGGLAGKTLTDADGSGYHSCGVASGAVYCWGYKNGGRLGLGNNESGDGQVPAAVVGSVVGKTATQVALGSEFSCALASGSVHCWGLGPDGQLGTGSTGNSNQAVAVVGDLVGKTVTAIAAGGGHACALTSTGAVYCWGNGAFGQLGNGSTASSALPVLVTGALTGKTVTAIAGGGDNTCAIAGGEVYCWGTKQDGRLGDGNTSGVSNVPVLINGGALSGKAVTVVGMGYAHTCAIAGGAAYCWGVGTSGELGNSFYSNSSLPVAVNVAGVLANKTVTAVTAGSQHTCAIADGALYCWGDNITGQLGDGNGGCPPCAPCAPPCFGGPGGPGGPFPFALGALQNSSVPVAVDTSVVLSGVKVRGVAAGYFHTLSW